MTSHQHGNRSLVFSICPALAVLCGLPLARIVTADDEPIALINHEISHVWDISQARPTPRATDDEWCRRIFLDLVGRIPTVAERAEFLKVPVAKRREWLATELLTSSRYRPEVARHFTGIWTNLLIGRTGGLEEDSLVSRAGMEQYLFECFFENRPYDQMVRELITATGTTRPGTPSFNGATNFLAMKLQDRAIQATSQTARIFLGTQVQCTQCHDHKFNSWKQSQFWELNAFFRQTVALRQFQSGTAMIRDVQVTDQDFAGEGADPAQAEVYFERPDGQLKVAYPVFLDGTPLKNPSGYLADVHRRQALADFVLASPLLEQAQVNRTWRHFLGYGFCEPVDDLGPHRQATHPELFAQLSRRFRAQQFDLRELMRWIVLSEPYARSSRGTAGPRAVDPSGGGAPDFSRFYLRQMSPEQLYDSLMCLTQGDAEQATVTKQAPKLSDDSQRRIWLAQFARSLGNDEGNETNTFQGNIPRTLMMFNGELMQRATDFKSTNRFSHIAASEMPLGEKIKTLYLTALSRHPTPREKRIALKWCATAPAWSISPDSPDPGWNSTAHDPPPPIAGLQDLWWSLLNSNEFLFIH